MISRIGFSKSLAGKAIILAVIDLQLKDAEVQLIKDVLQALFCSNATYQRSNHADKEERFATLRKKFEEASRSRPDPLQTIQLFERQARMDGKLLSEVVDSYIADFNGGSNVESKQLSETEQAIVKVFPELMPATQQLVAYHWDNFKAKKSGLPLFALWAHIVTHGVKLQPGVVSSLLTTILHLSPEAQHAFVRVLRPMAQITWWGWR